MEETKRLLREGLAEMHDVHDELSRISGSLKLTRRILAGVVAIVILGGYVVYRDNEFKGCMTTWAGQFTERSKALQGPGNQRVDLFFQAYTEAVGAADALSKQQRADIIDGLDSDRHTYSVLPAHNKLEASTDYQLLAYRDLIAALRANDRYQMALDAYPVPAAPTCGGILG